MLPCLLFPIDFEDLTDDEFLDISIILSIILSFELEDLTDEEFFEEEELFFDFVDFRLLLLFDKLELWTIEVAWFSLETPSW